MKQSFAALLALGLVKADSIGLWNNGYTCTGKPIGDPFEHIDSKANWNIDECEKACVAESKRFVIATRVCCDWHEVTSLSNDPNKMDPKFDEQEKRDPTKKCRLLDTFENKRYYYHAGADKENPGSKMNCLHVTKGEGAIGFEITSDEKDIDWVDSGLKVGEKEVEKEIEKEVEVNGVK